MSDNSVKSLAGLLSTKKLSDQGILKTGNTTQESHETHSFPVTLADSMKSANTMSITQDEQPDGSDQSELNSITDRSNNSTHFIELLTIGAQSLPAAETDENQKELHTGRPVSSLSENLNTMRIAKELAKDVVTEQPSTSLTDTLTANQYPSDMNEQKIPEKQSRSSFAKAPLNTADTELLSLTYNLPDSQTQELHNESVTGNHNGRLNAHSYPGLIPSVSPVDNLSGTKNVSVNNNANGNHLLTSIENSITGTELVSDKNGVNKAVNINTFFNTEENAKESIYDFTNTQPGEKISPAKTGSNQTDQKSQVPVVADSEESSVFGNNRVNHDEENNGSKVANSFVIRNNDTQTGEKTVTVNTPSDNPFPNNQGADTQYEFQINQVINRQNTEQSTNFDTTLSRTNNATNPLGTLGNDVADNIIQHAKLFMEGGKSEITMQLNPPELGTLKLEFTLEDDILETKITVERSAVKEAIEKDIPRLKELIANSDVDAGKLDVSLQERDNGRLGFLNRNFESDSGSNSNQDYPGEEKEYSDEKRAGDLLLNNTSTTGSYQINYLL